MCMLCIHTYWSAWWATLNKVLKKNMDYDFHIIVQIYILKRFNIVSYGALLLLLLLLFIWVQVLGPLLLVIGYNENNQCLFFHSLKIQRNPKTRILIRAVLLLSFFWCVDFGFLTAYIKYERWTHYIWIRNVRGKHRIKHLTVDPTFLLSFSIHFDAVRSFIGSLLHF